jgi:hypothetical protein
LLTAGGTVLERLVFALAVSLVPVSGALAGEKSAAAGKDGGQWIYVDTTAIPSGLRHVRHAAIFKRYAAGYNLSVLKAIDIVQAHAMDGGGYFTGLKAVPPESPIGYPLKLFGKALLAPSRTSSYCSGSTYGVLIEALNLIFPHGVSKLSAERLEALRMQEPDGARREDGVKYWGKWNDDGWGSNYALVQYSGMGEDIPPKLARPGDFMNISWKSGKGHSVVFLGWYNKDGQRGVVYWSSQSGTNGFSDVLCPLEKVASVRIVRLTHPGNVFTFDVDKQVKRDLPGDVPADGPGTL